MSAVAEERSSFARVPAAFRLQFAVPAGLIGVPAMVFLAAWAISLGIVVWIDQAVDRGPEPAMEPLYTGGSQAALWTLVFMAAYSATHTFPFAMALSYSRRVFVFGVFLAFAALSSGFGAAFALSAWIEQLSDGYGIEAYNFNLPYLTDGPGGLLSTGLVAAVLCLVLMLFGFGITMLFKRVGLIIFWVILLGLFVILVTAVMLVTVNEAWGPVWGWLQNQTALSMSGWLMLPTLGLAVLSYWTIRKAVPAT